MVAVSGIRRGASPDRLRKQLAHVSHEARQRPWRLRHMQDGSVLVRIATHHVHVDVGTQRAPNVRVLAQEGHRPLDLRPPDKAQGPGRPRQLAASDQVAEHPDRLKDRHAPARIVVRSWPLMVEMAAIDHLARMRVCTWYGCRHHRPVPVRHLCLHVRAQHHWLATGELRPPTRSLLLVTP